MEPYALENARLLKEQNELHKKLLLKNDEIDIAVRESKDQVKKYIYSSKINDSYLVLKTNRHD